MNRWTLAVGLVGAGLVLGCGPIVGEQDDGQTTGGPPSSGGAGDRGEGPGHSGDNSGGVTDGGTTDASTTGGANGAESNGGLSDTSTESTGSSGTNTTVTVDSTGDGVFSCPSGGEGNDAWEPNDLSETPAIVPWDSISMFGLNVEVDAILCPDEGDWYWFAVDEHEFEYYQMYIDVLLQGTTHCEGGCGGPFLPDAPENSVTIEVFNATTLELLGQDSGENGRASIYGWGEPVSHDFLIHVLSPTASATYHYDLVVEIRGYDGEDECEC